MMRSSPRGSRYVRQGQNIDLSDLTTKADLDAVEVGIEALRLSTKADLRETEPRLEAKIESLRKDMKADTETAKLDIIEWVFGAIGCQTLVTIGAVFAFARMLAR